MLFRSIGLRWVAVDGLEADDLAGVVGCTLAGYGHDVELLSGDRDWWQLASVRGIRVICEQGKGRAERYISDAICLEEFGCPIRHLLRLRPFIGDSSDKIPPVRPRFMKKKALDLVMLGCDPRLPYEKQNSSVKGFDFGKAAGYTTKDIWPEYQRNFKLMRIARNWDHCGMTDREFERIIQLCVGPLPPRDYKGMVAVMADWELKEAINRRTYIFNLADTGKTVVE